MEEFKPKSSLDNKSINQKEKRFEAVQDKPEIIDHSDSLLWKILYGVKENVWKGFLKPTLLDAGATAMKTVIDVIFFGSPTSQSKTNGYSNPSYQVYFKPQDSYPTAVKKPDTPIPGTFDFNSVDFVTYGKARYALDQLNQACENKDPEYLNYARVGDLYDLANYPVTSIDYDYGWRDVKNARIIQTPIGFETIRGGKFRIIFPNPPSYTK